MVNVGKYDMDAMGMFICSSFKKNTEDGFFFGWNLSAVDPNGRER